jgi:hypothetical protein
MEKFNLSSLVRPVNYTCNTVKPADFLEELKSLKVKPDVDYITMPNYKGEIRGYFQFSTDDIFVKVTVAVTAEVVPNIKGDTNLDKFAWCLKNTRLLRGRSTQGKDFLTFSASEAMTSPLDLEELIRSVERSSK